VYIYNFKSYKIRKNSLNIDKYQKHLNIYIKKEFINTSKYHVACLYITTYLHGSSVVSNCVNVRNVSVIHNIKNWDRQ